MLSSVNHWGMRPYAELTYNFAFMAEPTEESGFVSQLLP